MYYFLILANTVTAEAIPVAAKPFDATEVSVRNLLFPFVILVAGIIFKGISDVRKEHISNIRIIDAMLDETRILRNSWQDNKKIFSDAYAGGSQSIFASRIEADEKYYPYVVIGKSSGLVFSAENSPALAFKFIRSEFMSRIIEFHDNTSLLRDFLADFREDAFKDLPPGRKLAALGTIINQYEKAESKYAPCVSALEEQKLVLTSRSLTWVLLFPFRAKTWPAHLVLGWIILNIILRWAKIVT